MEAIDPWGSVARIHYIDVKTQIVWVACDCISAVVAGWKFTKKARRKNPRILLRASAAAGVAVSTCSAFALFLASDVSKTHFATLECAYLALGLSDAMST